MLLDSLGLAILLELNENQGMLDLSFQSPGATVLGL
jgi:hypothetical protein